MVAKKGYIVVIDDDVPFLELIKKKLKTLLNDQIICFQHAHRAVKFIQENKIDLAVVDMRLENHINGLDIGMILKSKEEKPFIVYCTYYDEYWKESLLTGLTYYINKNYLDEDLMTAYNLLLENNFRKIKNIDLFGTILNIEKVIYIKSEARRLNLYKSDNSYIELSNSLKETLAVLEKYKFIQIHKSYAVNTDYIDFIKAGKVYLKNGDRYPLGRAYAKNVKRGYGGHV